MKEGRLAILLPTYRFDATARHCIETIAAAGRDDVDVYIADNSLDPEKWAFLRRVADRSKNCHVFCHEHNIGGANFGFLVDQTDHEYLAPASDDDIFTPDYFLAGREHLRTNPDCAAAGGLFLFLTWNGGRLDISTPKSHTEETAVERIASYTNGLNALSYAVYRSDAMGGFNRYIKDRPFWPSYLDQIGTYTLLCAGKYVLDHSRHLFVYNNTNWTAANALASDGRWFTAAGLPPAFTHLNRLCWAADVLHYFNSSYRPEHLADQECKTIARDLFTRLFVGEFRYHVTHHPDAIGQLFEACPQNVDVLRKIVFTSPDDPETFLALFVEILKPFNADLAARYAHFVSSSLLTQRADRRLAS